MSANHHAAVRQAPGGLHPDVRQPAGEQQDRTASPRVTETPIGSLPDPGSVITVPPHGAGGQARAPLVMGPLTHNAKE